MKALHRILVSGTIAALAALAAASSGAFACTAMATVKLYVPGTTDAPGYLAPGDVLTVKLDRFEPVAGDFSPITFSIAIIEAGEIKHLMDLASPDAAGTFTVPNLPWSPNEYHLVAKQMNVKTGATVGRNSFPFFVWNGARYAANTGATPTTSPGTSPQPSVVPVPDDKQEPAPRPEAVGGSIGSARGMTPFAGTSPPAAPGSGVVIDPGAGSAATSAKGLIDGGSPPPEDRRAEGAAPLPQVPVGSLWSGLDGGDPPTLLDGPLPPNPTRGPLGGVLFGGGAALVALAASGAGLGRRRLAHARR